MRAPVLVSAGALAVMIVVDLLLGRDQPGFWPVFGFVSCIILILASKALGKRVLLRDPGYYEPSDAEQPDHGGGA
jgi:hypothetical protein